MAISQIDRDESAAARPRTPIWTPIRTWLRRGLIVMSALTVAACAASNQRGQTGRPSAEQPPTILGEGGVRGVDPAARAPGRTVPVDPAGQATIALLAPVGAADENVSAVGEGIVEAARLALRDIGDPALRLEVFDTRGDPATAAAAAQSAAQTGAAFVIGPLFAQSTKAAAPIARSAGLTMLSFSNDPSAAADNVFLLGSNTAQEIDRVLRFAAARGVREIAVLAPQNDFGRLALMSAQTAAVRSGVVIVDTQQYVRDFEGIEAAVTEFVERQQPQSELGATGEEPPIGPQGVLLADQGQALQTVAAYLAFFDISPRTTKFLGVSGWNSDTTQKETALRGGWFAAPDSEIRDQFTLRYQQALGRQPHPLAALGYDAIAATAALLADARAAGDPYPFTPQAIADPSGFAGVSGVYRFLPAGLNERGLAIFEVREGSFAEIDAAPKSFGGF